MDATAVGQIAAELMDDLAEGFPEGAEVGVVAVVVEVAIPPHEEAEHGATGIRVRCSDSRGWVQEGLLTRAARAIARDDAD